MVVDKEAQPDGIGSSALANNPTVVRLDGCVITIHRLAAFEHKTTAEFVRKNAKTYR